ncbi:Chromatin assembly factor 1 subunit B, putative [Penicillium digitatum]|uniref:Chromatin assembly factor 1 subunit B, putative n=3 Tax=Penicillium digitatum TaxID=36651 RepID=K9G492_PEND2|nr:Chromatin assembly factor 1 subunit B, putative [Penicillium digitatum Pd1]EKV08067.1 Chromatin assembly factor 1 subunit B, putative [Penicillium digitatum Pd1]EKV09663.1 Chromatin assembly factor 1 subunit B, putative [Penicillium digitatum PHI26]QQK41548.1 Chromatin assembly factor 1 subunit B, putative [Penicillium digitatum]
MKATPLLISWHNDNAPIYSVHFDPNGKGRLATAGNDNNVRLWKVESTGEERRVSYLSTLMKHTQAVNVVRFSPKGEMLASAGDDGNVLLWVPSEIQTQAGLGEDRSDDKETWRVKHMCRSSGAEIYDLAWSPDGVFIITGSMDNIARIYNAQTGQMVRQIAEHSHYVQGVAWDPLNEFVATQSSDRSVHIYTLKTKDGQFTLTPHGKVLKMDLPAKLVASNSPAPPEMTSRSQQSTGNSVVIASPAPSTPGTPMASNLPMDPPPVSHSRRSSFGSSPSIRRSASPAPSLPLPAVKPLEVSSPSFGGLGVKNASIYANETFTSFFRRLTFAPDGSLLFTPAGQFKTSHVSATDSTKTTDEIINTVYVYTRAGFNKPPISHLPGHKKPSVAVKCSPVFYTLKQGTQPAKNITLDTSSSEEMFLSLPDPVVSGAPSFTSQPHLVLPSSTTAEPSKLPPSQKAAQDGSNEAGQSSAPVFALPYRIVYAVATQDAVLVYDTQQQTPLCIVSNLHFATFTDLTWSADGLTLIMSSSDGFCSTLSFAPGELGQTYTGPTSVAHNNANPSTPATNVTPLLTPTPLASSHVPSPIKTSQASSSNTGPAPPASPARSSSSCSVVTQPSTQPTPAGVVNNPTPTLGTVPSVTATHSAQPPTLPLTTPPQTPISGAPQNGPTTTGSSVLGKRDARPASESEKEEGKADQNHVLQQPPKRRRVAPTLISAGTDGASSSK